MLAFALGVLLQLQPLEVTTSLERSRVAVGEEFLFTLRAVGHSTAPFRIELPPLDGLAIVERRERTDVVAGTAQTTRAYTLELELRAEQVGTWSIAPIRVEQGTASAFSSAESVTVSNTSNVASGLDQDLLALIPRVPPPRLGQPSVFTLASASRLFVGDQLNVLTGAWLPRGLRLRMRQPPTLTPPALSSVWVTPRRAIAGAVASRSVEGESYDLYVSFQTAYPLNPGPLTIPPARLGWMQPARQYLGPEQRESVASTSLTLAVEPLPAAGRPAGFDGPVARGLLIEYELGASSARAGAVLPVTVVLSGEGNLPLWPAPRIAWPASVRVYQEASEDRPRLSGSRIGGSKRFRFTILPDSAGSLSLPALEYSYFDPVPATYRSARASAIVVPVLEALPVAQQRNPL
ncbi:MAG TPA: BatD family protein, partial [Gemmatimonadales bacterium]|nr:BatD family protein [Gemmatimonadales bacterium]